MSTIISAEIQIRKICPPSICCFDGKDKQSFSVRHLRVLGISGARILPYKAEPTHVTSAFIHAKFPFLFSERHHRRKFQSTHPPLSHIELLFPECMRTFLRLDIPHTDCSSFKPTGITMVLTGGAHKRNPTNGWTHAQKQMAAMFPGHRIGLVLSRRPSSAVHRHRPRAGAKLWAILKISA